MGEIADLYLEGTLCEDCGEEIVMYPVFIGVNRGMFGFCKDAFGERLEEVH